MARRSAALAGDLGVFGDFSRSEATASPRGNNPQGQAMGQVKKAVLDLVKKLPADCTLRGLTSVQYRGNVSAWRSHGPD